MLTPEQKQVIYNAFPVSYVIDEVAFNPTRIYSNQFRDTIDHQITLKYTDQNIASIRGFVFSQAEYPEAVLSINIYAKNYKSGSKQINGSKITSEIARSLIAYIKTNWIDNALGQNITLKDISRAEDLTDVEQAVESEFYRIHFDVTLLYLYS